MSILGLQLRGFGSTTGVTTPATPTLAIVDDEDGTGATATISAGNGSATNVIKTAPAATFGAMTFTTTGTRVGNGTVDLSLSDGLYWGYCVSTLSSVSVVSNFVPFRVSSSTTAVYYQCMTEVRSIILTLSLSGLTSDEVRLQKLPWRANQVAEGIFVTPTSESLSPRDGTNERDDIGYPVQVVMIQKSNLDQTINFNRFLLWRQKIRRAFHNQPLPILGVHTAYVEPGAVILPSAFDGKYDVASLIVRCISREVRGLS